MDRTLEYRKRAEECREMARSAALPNIKENYEELAAMWEKMAEERLKFFVPDEAQPHP
jgi:hypothetical protein